MLGSFFKNTQKCLYLFLKAAPTEPMQGDLVVAFNRHRWNVVIVVKYYKEYIDRDILP
jgi:hypothetical protein